MLDEALAVRRQLARRRALVALGVSATVTVIWALAVTWFSLWPRVASQWVAAVTMGFGSFVAGSTPQGGGAVAFPVFTKVLAVPPDVARTFSLCIQAIGMGVASLSIMINRRRVEWRGVGWTTAGAVLGFVGVIFLASDPEAPFRPVSLPAPYVKVTFTIVLMSMAAVVYISTRVSLREVHHRLPRLNHRMRGTLVVLGVLGGCASAMIGSGADVFMYVGLVVFFGLDPKVGVPSSVIGMASISVLGLILLGLLDGQLLVTLAGDDPGRVLTVGGQTVALGPEGRAIFAAVGTGDLPSSGRYDLLGMWLAAAPIVAWGAPFGAWLAAHMSARRLVQFVTALVGFELVTTAVFLDALHRDMLLVAYGVGGSVLLLGGLYLVNQHRRHLYTLPEVDLELSVHPARIDVSTDFHQSLEPQSAGSRPPEPRV